MKSAPHQLPGLQPPWAKVISRQIQKRGHNIVVHISAHAQSHSQRGIRKPKRRTRRDPKLHIQATNAECENGSFGLNGLEPGLATTEHHTSRAPSGRRGDRFVQRTHITHNDADRVGRMPPRPSQAHPLQGVQQKKSRSYKISTTDQRQTPPNIHQDAQRPERRASP